MIRKLLRISKGNAFGFILSCRPAVSHLIDKNSPTWCFYESFGKSCGTAFYQTRDSFWINLIDEVVAWFCKWNIPLMIFKELAVVVLQVFCVKLKIGTFKWWVCK